MAAPTAPGRVNLFRANQPRCESCEYYDYDDDWGENVCRVELDEDEMLRFLTGTNSSCPYYKFYDEYKSVQKQN